LAGTFRAITVSKLPIADQRTFDPNEKTPSERLTQGESAHRPFDPTTIQPKGRSPRGYRPSRFWWDTKGKRVDWRSALISLLHVWSIEEIVDLLDTARVQNAA
jgi:hypothetical protein